MLQDSRTRRKLSALRHWWLLTTVALLAASAGTLAQAESSDVPAPIAETRHGPVEGVARNGVIVFKGIRYGADTSGERRFLPPAPPASWTEVRQATAFSARCHGPDYPPFLMQEEGVDLDKGPKSEDCLFLNLWTAALDDGKRPVMVWLHGGGYSAGSGGSERYDGSNLAAKQDVVVITLNHRLGAFGFMDLSSVGGAAYAESGNAGMLDIVAALQWVRDNAARFGGDPGNVTVFGESGGGAKATTLMSMPAAKGLFHKAIAQSGVEIASIPAVEAAQTARAAMEAVGARDVAGLVSAEADALLANAKGDWGPVLGISLPRSPFDPDANPAANDIPLLLGSTETETTFFNATPLAPIDDAAMREALVTGNFTKIAADKVDALVAAYRAQYPGAENHRLVQLISSDAWITQQVATVSDRRAAAGAPTFVYRFAMPQGAREGALGVPHTAEIAYAFDNLDLSKALVGEPDAADRTLAERMSLAWTHFARTGTPAAEGLPDWPRYTAGEKAVMVLDAEPRIVVDPYNATLGALAEAKKP